MQEQQSQPRQEFVEERELMKVRPAMFRAKPILFSVYTLALLACVGGAIWAWFWSPQQWLVILFGIGFAVVFGLFAWWRINTWAVVLRITTERTVEDRGFFSRVTSEVMHHNIRNVQITQSFWNRLWKVGQLQIASAGHEGYEITFNDVPMPYEVKRVIDEHRDYGEDD